MVIISSVSDSHLEYIKEIDVAYEMVKKLEGIFSKKGTCSKFYLLKELINLKYNGNSDLQEHFAKSDRIFRELKSLGSCFEDSDMSCFLLLSMPPEYENVVTAIRTLSENDLKIEFVKSRLLEFDMNKNSSKGVKNNNSLPSSFSASHKQVKCFKCGKIGHVKSMCGIKCYVCGKLGHKSKECFSNNNKNKSNTNNKAHFAEGEYSNKSKKEVNNGEPVAFCGMMHDESELEMIEWYADSGATHHYINDEKSLKNIRKFTKPR